MITSSIVISGVPACGKTTFGNWLRDNRSFLHLDMEADTQLEQTGLLWTFYSKGEHDKVRNALQRLKEANERLVVTWGFVPNATGIGLLRTFRSVGFQPWWFTGPIETAREAWVVRDNRPNSGLFDGQMQNIAFARTALDGLYADTTIQTLWADGTRLSPEEIEIRIAAFPPAPAE